MVAGGGAAKSRSGGGNLFAALFGGGGGDEDESTLDAGDTVQANPSLHHIETASMAPVDASSPRAEPAVLLPKASSVPLPGVRPVAVADAGTLQTPPAAEPAVARVDGGPPGGQSKYPDLLAYAAPVPQLPPSHGLDGSLATGDGAQAATAELAAADTSAPAPSRAGGHTPVPGLRPELVAYAQPADDAPMPAFAAVAKARRSELKASDIAASARRKLTRGDILVASLGPIPVVGSHGVPKARPEEFASVSGDEIRGGRLGSGAAGAKRRLTEAVLAKWAKERGRSGIVTGSVPVPRMNRPSPPAQDSARRSIDPQRFAAISVYFPNE